MLKKRARGLPDLESGWRRCPLLSPVVSRCLPLSPMASRECTARSKIQRNQFRLVVFPARVLLPLLCEIKNEIQRNEIPTKFLSKSVFLMDALFFHTLPTQQSPMWVPRLFLWTTLPVLWAYGPPLLAPPGGRSSREGKRQTVNCLNSAADMAHCHALVR